MDNEHKILGLKVLFGSMSLCMAVLAIQTSLKSNMFQLPPEAVNEPWIQTTLVDFYFNITILSAWVLYRETSRLKAIGWIIAFIFLGSIATCFYVLKQLLGLKPGEGLEKIFLKKAKEF